MNERGGADGYMRGVYRRSHEERLAVTTLELKRVGLTTGGKDHFAYVSRWGLIRAAFSKPGKDVYL